MALIYQLVQRPDKNNTSFILFESFYPSTLLLFGTKHLYLPCYRC